MRAWARVAITAAAAAVLLSATAASARASAVLPASAQPHGWSLTRMTGEMALFSTGGNDAAYYPQSPFQVLYVGPSSFTVAPGTDFFVPLWNATDSAPIVGTWPTTHEQAVSYFFDPAQLGGRDFSITVDGERTAIDGAYVAGPVTTPTLLDCAPPESPCGHHIITVGAFLHPLTPGTHTVRIQGGLFGAEVLATYGQSFTEDITYSVTVR